MTDNAQPTSGTYRGVGWVVFQGVDGKWFGVDTESSDEELADKYVPFPTYPEAHAAAIKRCDEIADRLRAERGVTRTINENGQAVYEKNEITITRGLGVIGLQLFDPSYTPMHLVPLDGLPAIAQAILDCYAEMVAEFGDE